MSWIDERHVKMFDRVLGPHRQGTYENLEIAKGKIRAEDPALADAIDQAQMSRFPDETDYYEQCRISHKHLRPVRSDCNADRKQ